MKNKYSYKELSALLDDMADNMLTKVEDYRDRVKEFIDDSDCTEMEMEMVAEELSVIRQSLYNIHHALHKE